MTGTKLSISPLHSGAHVPVAPGATITVRGAFVSRHDGTVTDAATTQWPADAPGGASLEAGGFIDLPAGGFEITARDPGRHEVQAVATGGPAPGCEAFGLAPPCLVMRTAQLAHSRLLTKQAYVASLRGEMTIRVPRSLAAAPADPAEGGAMGAPDWASQALVVGAGAWAVAIVLVSLWLVHRRWAGSARCRVGRLVCQIKQTALTADPILSEVLAPPLTAMVRALRDRRLDPASAEGRRLERRLQHLHSALASSIVQQQRLDERRVADDLAGQLQLAVEAAAEASRAA